MIPAVGLGAYAIGSELFNAFSQGRSNKKARQWQEKMYYQQRRDALTDWNMQNEYNSPHAQMARLKAAGLNPNLVYGHGAEAISQAPPRSSSAGSWNPKPPTVDMQRGLDSFYDTQLKQATYSNLTKQGEVLEMEKNLKAAQQLKVLGDTKMTKFNLQQRARLADTEFEFRNRQIEKLLQDTKYTHYQNIRADKMNNQQIAESVARIITMSVGNKLTYANINKALAETETILYNRFNIQPKVAERLANDLEKQLIDALNRHNGTMETGDATNIIQDLLKYVLPVPKK